MDQPNILLVVIDSVRQDALSCYGNEKRTTPRIDRLAAESTVFDNHFSAAGWTFPSHAAMFTGKLPSEVGGFSKEEFEPGETVARRLQEKGYETFGIRTVAHISRDYGYDTGFDRYIDAHHDYSRKSMNPYLAVDTVIDRVWGRRNRTFFAYNLLKQQVEQSEAPFFGFINFTTAHRPYHPPFFLEWKFRDGVDADTETLEALMNKSGSQLEEELATGTLQVSAAEWQREKKPVLR